MAMSSPAISSPCEGLSALPSFWWGRLSLRAMKLACVSADGQQRPSLRKASKCSRKLLKDQATIISACHAVPLPLTMSAGFLSKFPASWRFLASALAGSHSGEEAIFRIIRILHAKGASRFEGQLRYISCLPQGKSSYPSQPHLMYGEWIIEQ